ncbi:MAG: polyphenol oxidase family protein [Gemmatimonadetes bacterium]|nr:polyphenol oxidase family protein [Gemmatimonadota bacterium]MDA1102522.1 polyphenol oxidase family protein [Gemmatimonadota bacterium]
MTTDSLPPRSFARIREIPVARPPALVHPGWLDEFPWLVQGTTTRGGAGRPFDLGLFSGGTAEAEVLVNWEELRVATGATCVMHSRQVHGSEVRVHGGTATGLSIVGACDGHMTREPGVLLGVTIADCVPVFVVDASQRAVAAVHAGWRGAAEGVLERSIEAMATRFGTDTADVYIHLGPSICGDCYEVGPEVFEALGQSTPDRPTPIDLRAALGQRAVALGVDAERVSVSTHCTRCSDSALFSHRGGDAGRQVGYVGIRS